MTPIDDSESVEYKILLDAMEAQRGLQDLTSKITNFDTKITAIIDGFKNFSMQSGLHIKTVSKYFQDLEKQAEKARGVIKLLGEAGMVDFITPDLKKLASIQPLFDKFSGPMWKELNTQIAISEKELANAEKIVWKIADQDLVRAKKETQEWNKFLKQVYQEGAKIEAIFDKLNAQKMAASGAPASFLGRTLGSPEEARAIVTQLQQINKLSFLDPKTYQANVTSLMGIIKGLATTTGSSFQEVGSYISKSFTNIPNITMASSDAVKKLGNELRGTSEHAERFRRGIDAARIAMGTLVAMAIFRFFNFLETSLLKAIDGFKQLELAIYKIKVAEKSLSEAGIEITPKEFEEIVAKIRESFTFISDIDTRKMVGDVALLTKDLRLTKEQLEELMTSIPAMAIAGSTTIEQATQQVVNGLTTSGRGWKDLGITVDAAIIKQRAVSDGLVASAEAYNKLTAEQKQQVEVQALINILGDKTNEVISSQDEYVGTLDESTRSLSSSWETMLAKFMELASPLLIKGIRVLTDSFEGWIGIIKTLKPLAVNFFATLVALIDTAGFKITHFNASLADLLAHFAEMQSTLIEKGMKELGDFADTPTANIPLDITPEIDTTKAEEKIEDLLEDLEDLDQKEVKIVAEFEEKQLREQTDHLIDMARDEEDYRIKRSRFIEDSNEKIADKNKEFHDRELNEEAKFQEELRQLRERYLFDLEDALRDRDARQVLRLMEKYRMDKQAMINEFALRKKGETQRHADDVAQAKKEQADKLAQMDEDHALEMQRKEADYQLKRQRELEDHNQQLEDLRRLREEKLKEAAAAIAEELGIKGAGVQAIYELLNKYYGPNGLFDGLYDYTNRSMIARAEQMLAQLVAITGQFQSLISPGFIPAPGFGSGGGGTPGIAMAEGGTLLANRPTNVTFGEAGPELATFIPLGRGGLAGMGSLSGGGAGAGGNVSIELWLSPDLESRIIDNTMNGTAKIIRRVSNSKN